MESDSELLKEYIETHTEAAFAELVLRHLALVYSAARRRTSGNAHLAEEVSQSVFTQLARNAIRLQSHPNLIGWLYTTTYHIADRTARSEQRRLHRETEAHLMHANLEQESIDWEKLSPVLDEAMLRLKEQDRMAILLRFFSNKAYPEIGAELGLSENAARMRVDRALESLRSTLSLRGITSTVVVLGSTLGANATVAVPTGLASSIVAVSASTATAGILSFIMSSTITKTSIIAATALVVAGGGIGWFRQEQEISDLRSQNESLNTLLKTSQAAARQSLEKRAKEVAQEQTSASQQQNMSASLWMERAQDLKQMVQQVPSLWIPELALATEEDWLDATKQELKTQNDYRRAAAAVRAMTISRFSQKLHKALRAYLAEHGNQFPDQALTLQPYMQESIDPQIWARYEVAPASAVPNVGVGPKMIKPIAVVDEEFDNVYVIGADGTGSTSYVSVARQQVMSAYMKANPGMKLTNPEQLRPYARTPYEQKVLEDIIKNWK